MAESFTKNVTGHNHELDELYIRIAELETQIAENKLAEDALMGSEKVYKTFFENSRDAICLVNSAGNYVVINQHYVKLFGYTKEELLKMNVRQIYANPKDREKFHKKVEKYGFLDNYEGEYLKKDGTLVYCESTAAISMDNNGNILGYWGIIRDITERKKNEKRIRNYQIKLRNLLSKITLTEEKERRLITSNLHDIIGQNLAFTKTKLVELQKSLSSTRFRKNLNDIVDIVEQTNKDVYSLIFEISPPILYELGFVPAV